MEINHPTMKLQADIFINISITTRFIILICGTPMVDDGIHPHLMEVDMTFIQTGNKMNNLYIYKH